MKRASARELRDSSASGGKPPASAAPEPPGDRTARAGAKESVRSPPRDAGTGARESGHHRRVQERRARAARAEQLRKAGADVLQIASALSCSRWTVYSYLADPANERNRRLKRSYRGQCQACGASTSAGDGPGHPRQLCPRCRSAARRRWTRHTVTAALNDWSRRFGAGRPPSSYELERSAHVFPGRYPSPRTCRRLFGGYAAALAALDGEVD